MTTGERVEWARVNRRWMAGKATAEEIAWMKRKETEWQWSPPQAEA